MQTTAVMDMNTGEFESYLLRPEDAVIVAYAHSIGDYDVFNYGKYRPQLIWGRWSVACGDFCAQYREIDLG
jgi:hypothetical protein